MCLRRPSVWGALLLALAMLALVPDVSAAPTDWPGNSANAKACQKGGWQLLHTSAGQPFTSEQECVSYGAHGGILVAGPILVVTATVGFCGGPDPYCWGAFTGSGLEALSAVDLHYTFDGDAYQLTRYADWSGNISSTGPFGWLPGEGIFACGGVVSNVYATGTTASAAPITSNVIATSPC